MDSWARKGISIPQDPPWQARVQSPKVRGGHGHGHGAAARHAAWSVRHPRVAALTFDTSPLQPAAAAPTKRTDPTAMTDMTATHSCRGSPSCTRGTAATPRWPYHGR